MKSLSQFVIARALLLAGLFGTGQCMAQTIYTQTTTNILTAGPSLVAKSATAAPNDFINFSNAVKAAYATNSGGVLDFPTAVATGTTVYRGKYAGGTKQFSFTSSVSMQNSTAGGGTFTPTSGANLTTSSANQSAFNLAMSTPADAGSGLPLAFEGVGSVGFVILSRTSTAYPLDVRATATFSDGSTQSATTNIGNVRATDNTFYGFTAPAGLTITNLQLQSFSPGTTTPVADRMGIDDFAFITKPVNIPPSPAIYNVTPLNYAIYQASNGIHFQVQSGTSVDPTNISLVLNSTDVTSQLSFTGPSTNYSVSFLGLLPNQRYAMTINATNIGGVSTLTETFYTTTTPFALYESQGFSDDTLYPLGPLQAVTVSNVFGDAATWAPDASEPATIVDAGAPQGKALQRLNTGAARSDVLTFAPISAGTLTIEFDAWVSTTQGRTLDVSLQPLGGSGTTMASFLAWGQVAGELDYYNNVSWLTVAALPSGWHHCKIINYISGPSAGRYDVLLNGLVVGQRLVWRNAVVGSAFNRMRIQSQNTNPLLEYGEIDNLVVAAGPEDQNAVPPPLIVPILPPSDNAIVRASSGFSFGLTSSSPVATTNIGVLLNGTDVSSALQLSGPATNLTISYPGLLAETNHVAAIGATNSGGAASAVLNFISTEQPWLYDPSDGWVGPWQFASGLPQILTTNRLTNNAPYIDFDIQGGTRNVMRQYTSSASVDITQSHFIRWKFRLAESVDNFAADFTQFNDRVHFFARNAPRLTAGTDAADSWAISATGAEQTPGSGISAGQRFYIFDNLDGTGAYNLTNLVDSQIQLFPQHIYSFEVLVYPQTQTYSVVIVDETSSTSFHSAAPHLFRASGVTATSHTFLHFGVAAATTTVSRPFDFGPISISSAAPPALKLVNPVFAGGTFSFSFQSLTGVTYVAQSTGDLSSHSWTSLVTNVGNGTVITVTHTNPPVARAFYRVQSAQQ